MQYCVRFLVVFFVVLAVTFVMAAQSYAVLFTATQVLINPGDLVSTITVKNTTDKPKTYRFKWAEMRMNEDGSGLRLLKEGETVEGLMPASEYIRFSPRRIRMLPGQLQQVRFLVRKNGKMKDGEYRSYFSMEAEPEVTPLTSGASDVPQAGVTYDVGWRIPVILRHGKLTASAEFVSAKLDVMEDGRRRIKYTLKRSGNISMIAPMRVICASDGDKLIMNAGTKIYTELSERTNSFVIPEDAQTCQDMVLQLVSDADEPVYDAGKVIDEIAIVQ